MRDNKENNEVDSGLKLLVKSSIIVFIGLFFSKLLTYVYRIIIARYYGPEIYGIFSLAVMIFGWILAFSSLGLPEGLIRYIALYRGEKDERKIKHVTRTSIKLLLATGLIFGIILFFLSAPLSKFFNTVELEIFLKIFAFLLPFALFMNLFLSIIRAYEKITAFSLISNILFALIPFLALSIFIFLKLPRDSSIAISYSLGFVLAFFVSFIFIKLKIKTVYGHYKLNSNLKKKITKNLFSYSWPLIFLGILVSFLYWVDSIVIGRFRGVEEVGLYNAAVPIVGLLVIVSSLFTQLLFPLITREYSSGKMKSIEELSKQVNKWVWVLNFPLFLVIFIFPETLLRILFGHPYVAVASALRILSVGAFLANSSIVSINLLSMLGKSKTLLVDILVVSIINLILNILLVPKYGLNGAAFSTSFSWFLITVILLVQIKRFMNIFPFRRKILRIILVSIPLVILFFYLKTIITTTLNMFFLASLFVLLYFLIIFLFSCLDRNDMMILKKIRSKLY